MKRSGLLISKYLVSAVLPYFAFSWLLLSVILFVQQASRFSDIFFSVNIPANLIWQLSFALVPNVIAFTCPMAMLVGTGIGLAKMQTDSELLAIRAAGVGNLQITFPIALFGVLLSVFAFFVNLKGVPLAAAFVRRVALQSAIKKLESPVEPGVFNSEVAGYTIFVRDGDLDSGRWNNIFIYSENVSAGDVRIITAERGRIDVSGQLSELVLENAVVSTLPVAPAAGKYVSENLGEIRFGIKTRRGEMIERLGESGGSIEELGLTQLSDYASTVEGRDRIEAQILWYRRIILSTTPLIFSLLGTGMVLRFSRGGRGLGILLALLILIAYYLLTFLGEQISRTGLVSAALGGLIPVFGSLLAIAWFNYSARTGRSGGLIAHLNPFHRERGIERPKKIQLRNHFVDVTTGIRDFDITLNLVKYFLLSLSFLASVFVIFTAFDLWKFAAVIDGGTFLIGKYLFYLMPFVYLQLAPASAMVGTLATYIIKSRQNEIVTWTSAGQSVYRLLLPCFLATAALGIINWEIQERVLPGANQKQDAIRTFVRGWGASPNESRKHWFAHESRIYQFEYETFDPSDSPSSPALSPHVRTGSDNEIPSDPCVGNCVKNLAVFEFRKGGAELQNVYRADNAFWRSGEVVVNGLGEKSDLSAGKFSKMAAPDARFAEISNPFRWSRTNSSHLNIAGIKEQIDAIESEPERRNLAIALEKKYATLVLPFVIALFTVPFAFSLSRKAKVATVGYAVVIWLLFMGTSSIFEQFGVNGYLSAASAIWSPLVIFTLLGIYSLSRVRT